MNRCINIWSSFERFLKHWVLCSSKSLHSISYFYKQQFYSLDFLNFYIWCCCCICKTFCFCFQLSICNSWDQWKQYCLCSNHIYLCSCSIQYYWNWIIITCIEWCWCKVLFLSIEPLICFIFQCISNHNSIFLYFIILLYCFTSIYPTSFLWILILDRCINIWSSFERILKHWVLLCKECLSRSSKINEQNINPLNCSDFYLIFCRVVC